MCDHDELNRSRPQQRVVSMLSPFYPPGSGGFSLGHDHTQNNKKQISQCANRTQHLTTRDRSDFSAGTFANVCTKGARFRLLCRMSVSQGNLFRLLFFDVTSSEFTITSSLATSRGLTPALSKTFRSSLTIANRLPPPSVCKPCFFNKERNGFNPYLC